MKLQGTKPGETPDQRIIRCANNLVKAMVAGGYSVVGSVPGCNNVNVWMHKSDNSLRVEVYGTSGIICVSGKLAIRVPYLAEYIPPTPDELVADEAEV